jgi:hypothetical protein
MDREKRITLSSETNNAGNNLSETTIGSVAKLQGK